MLSIVICHRNEALLTAITKNIEATVGVVYELIVIDNTNNNYTILSAYNEGVRRAKYDYICFTHEDILFYTSNWGRKVVNHFDNPEVGMLGVAGGLTQSSIPSAWWYNNYFRKSARNMLMREKKSGKLFQYTSNPFNESKAEAVIIDGLWFCIRRSLFNYISFDENTFTGFHLYDADISMQVLQHAKNFIIYDILLEHQWSGNISKDYYLDLIKFSKKWSNKLPVQSKNVAKDYMNIYNWHALRYFILEMKTKDFTKQEINNFLNTYYPVAKQYYNSKWFNAYFLLSKKIGFANANRIFYRLEKISGFCKLPDFVKTRFKQVAPSQSYSFEKNNLTYNS